MALPTYPATDFDRGKQLLMQLGSFWVNLFEDRDKLQTHLRSEGQNYGQTLLNFYEAVATVSRLTTPVFHTENWYLMVIKRSETDTVASVYQPDDLVYGTQTGTVPGRPAGFTQTYGGVDKPGVVQARLPDHLVDCPFVMQNLVVFPSRVMTKGIDYDINVDRQLVRFHSDPFVDPLLARRDIFDDQGRKIDEEVAIWVYKGLVDLDYIFNHFGYVLGLKLQSSQNYKDLLNAFWDMHVLGMSLKSLQTFLSALSGAQTIIDPTEVLEVIRTEELSQLIVTNTHVYRFPLGANLLVDAGDIGTELHAGDPLSDAVQVEELSGANPDYSLLPAFSFSPDFLSGGYFSELSFKNETVALEYLGLDDDGKAVVRFETSGYPGDVERFWTFVQTQGKMPGNRTLAELLDTRTDPTDQPGPLALPPTINPLEFVLSNLMKNNLFIIRARQASFDPRAPGIVALRLLRSVIPPHTTYVIFIELEPLEEAIDLSQAGGEDTPGVEETLSKFKAKGPLLDEAYESGSSPGGDVLAYGDVRVLFKAVSLTCGNDDVEVC